MTLSREQIDDDYFIVDRGIAMSDDGVKARLAVGRLRKAALRALPEPQARPDATPDEDGDCTVCGLPWSDEKETLEPHVCPPGFLRTEPQKDKHG